MSNDPDLLDVWVECDACIGEGTQIDDNDLDIDCPECDGDGGWEQHRPSVKPTPSRFDERYDPSPEPIDRKIR